MAREPKIDQHRRLGEIIEVLRRNEITREMTPEKLCAVMEELGPTFIKTWANSFHALRFPARSIL